MTDITNVPAALARQLEALTPACDLTVITGHLFHHHKQCCPDPAEWVGTLTDIEAGQPLHLWAICQKHRDDLTRHFATGPNTEWLRFTSRPLRRPA